MGFLYLLKVVLFLYSHSVEGFMFHGVTSGYRYLVKELSKTAIYGTSSVETRWIDQPLDHFDSKENRTWKMRYFENLEFYKPNGTIFVFLGGEGEATPLSLTTGTLYELAKETNGAMFGSEHRYYGKSIPLDIRVTENLKYLSSQQALADVAKLLDTLKSSPKFKSSKVVVIGGSYPGNLAAWMKLLYPGKIDAAVASSAPVLAKADFYEYLEAVSDDYKQLGPTGCHDKIANIFRRYEDLFKNATGIEKLKQEEKICEDNDMSKLENQQLFFLDKVSKFKGHAQYGTPHGIITHCLLLSNISRVSSSKEMIGNLLNLWREEDHCSDYDYYNYLNSTRKDDSDLPWAYQTCTEFGYYQTTSSDNQPFTKNVPVEFYYKMCKDLFGPEFDRARVESGVKTSNKLYGGLTPNVTQVVFVNGDMDPWSRLGVLKNISYDAPAKVIPQASHCRDLFSNPEGDPEELKEARKYVKYLIKKWLGFGDYKLD